MTVNRTTLLDLPLPVTGTESGTWGDTTNNGLTQYMDIAIAGMSNLTSANFTTGALTIETTEGNSSATNITATSGQYAGFRVTSLAQNSTITVGNTGTSPARSYRLINADATYTLTFKATGQTGITLQPGQTAVVAFNGTDYVIVGMAGAGTVTDNAVVRFDGTTGKLVQNSVVTIADSTGDISGVGQLNATTVDTTNLEVTNIKAIDGTAAASIANSTGVVSITVNPVLSGGTANGVLYLNGSKVATSGSALTFDGASLGLAGANLQRLGFYNSSAASDEKTYAFQSGSAIGNGVLRLRLVNDAETTGINAYVIDRTGTSIDYQAWSAGTIEQMRLDITGLGIGTSSPAYKLEVVAPAGDNITALFRSGDATAANNAGGGFRSISSATAASRQAQVWLDADGANFGGGDYFYINKNGNSGTVDFVQYSNAAMRFYTNNTLQATIDSSGNLGLGVTPSAWNTVGKAFEFSQGGNAVYASASNTRYDTSNAYLNSSGNFIYSASNFATFYNQYNGAHSWHTAPSGTAGNAISFTQAMTLDASGNWLLGTTSNIGSARASIVTASGVTLNLEKSSGASLQFTYSSGTTDAQLAGGANGSLLIYTGNTLSQKACITSGGNLQITNGGSFQVGGTAARATTAGTNRVDIFNGTAPVGTLTNGISLYSSSGEAYVMDAAGNATLFSPHDAETNEWVFKSKHTPTGKVLKIDVEKLLRFVNDHFGLDAVHEFVES